MLNHPNRKAAIKKALGYYAFGVKDNNEALPYTPFVPGETPDEVFGVGWWTEFHSRKEVGQIYRPKEIVELNPSALRQEEILQRYTNLVASVTKSGQYVHLDEALSQTIEIQKGNVLKAETEEKRELENLLLVALNTLLGEVRVKHGNCLAEEETKRLSSINNKERRKETDFLKWISKNRITEVEINAALVGGIPYVCALLAYDNSSENNQILNQIAESSVEGSPNRALFSSRVRDYVLGQLRKEFADERDAFFRESEAYYIRTTQKEFLEAFNAGVLSYGGNRPLGVGEVETLLNDKEAFIRRLVEASPGWKELAEGVIYAYSSKDIHQVVQAYLRDVDGGKKLGAFRNAEYKRYVPHETSLKAHEDTYQEIINTEISRDNQVKRELLKIAALLNGGGITTAQAHNIIKDKNKDKDKNLFVFYLKKWGLTAENIEGILATTGKELYRFVVKEYEESRLVESLTREGKNVPAAALRVYLDKINSMAESDATLKTLYKTRVETIKQKLTRYNQKLKDVNEPDKLMKLSEKSGIIAFQYQNQMNLKVANSFFSLNKRFYDKATKPAIVHP